MAVKDIRSNIAQSLALLAAVSGNGTSNGAIIDTANFENGLMFSVAIPAFTDGSYAFTIEEGEDSGLSDAAAVSSDKLIGTLAGLTLTAATAQGGALNTIGVFSNKRYVRINAVATGVTTGATVVAVASQAGEEQPVV